MNSRLASDTTVREILEKLALLERAAGVRAHYRILDPLPITSTDTPTLQTAARMIGDWIGLRNALFHVVIGDGTSTTSPGVRIDKDQEEFTVELPRSAASSVPAALTALARAVARVYLYKANVAGASVSAAASGGILTDVTAVFLGLGKLMLNGVTPGSTTPPASPNGPVELQPAYVAFTHRAVCSMRGLDWSQHQPGLSDNAITLLHQWDPFHEDVFNLSLRNVLTAAPPHRPLLDAISDNQVSLARFDQIIRHLQAQCIVPLRAELKSYHEQCNAATTRVNSPEPETYDPCLVYLNQLRRRMDLQRIADSLGLQQDAILNRIAVLLQAAGDLRARGVLSADVNSVPPEATAVCPIDGTHVGVPDAATEARARCPTCNYEFLAASPRIAMQPLSGGPAMPASSGRQDRDSQLTPDGASAQSARRPRTSLKWLSTDAAMKLLIFGVVLLSFSWLPLLGYVLYAMLVGGDINHAEVLGKGGIIGSALGGLAVAVSLLTLAVRRLSKPASPSPAAGNSASGSI